MTPGGISGRPTAREVGRVHAVLAEAEREALAAFGLLTRFPVRTGDAAPSDRVPGVRSEAGDASGAIAFPFVGAVVGLIGAVPLVLVGWLQPVAGILALAAIAVVTGALHLDGLADTADALLAPSPERAERARKDPAVGPGGVVAVLLVVAIEISALAAIATTAGTWRAAGALLLASVASRTVAVAETVGDRSRVASDGFGAWFAARVGVPALCGATIMAVAIGGLVAVGTGSVALVFGGVVGAALGLGVGRIVVALRGQLDGDGLGATVELTVACVLTVTALVVTAPMR